MKFEESIERRRGEIDAVERVPRDLIWHGIQEAKRKQRARTLYLRVSVAASILVLIGAFAILNLNETGQSTAEAQYSEEFNSEESKYYMLASDKMAEINYSALDREQFGEIISELEDLDSMYNDLKTELASVPNAEKAIETAIKFHERRLQILELLEREIENRKREETNESNIKI